MAMSVHTNAAALTGTQHLMKSTEGLNKTMERLSTGMKINSAADDASGLVTSEYQRSHISGLKGGISNIDRAVAMVQTAESGMQEVNSLLIKLREVAVNSANAGTLDANALAANQSTVSNLLTTIDRIATTTKFGTQNLLDGTAGMSGTAANADVTFLATNSESVAGEYAVNVTTAAVKAKVVGLDAMGDVAAGGETLTLNGVNIEIEGEVNKVALVARINQFTSQTGVVATEDGAGKLQLEQQSFGSAPGISVVSSIAEVAADTNSGIGADVITDETAGQTDGADVVGKINGVAATGAGNVLTGAVSTNQEGVAVTIAEGAGLGAKGNVVITDGGPQFQIGAFAGENTTVRINSVTAASLGQNTTQKNSSGFSSLATINVENAAKASDSIQLIDAAISEVSTQRGTLGSFQANTLQATQSKMRLELKNMQVAESQIRETDFETEIAEFTAAQIRQQVATAVLSSANQQPQMILSLLRG